MRSRRIAAWLLLSLSVGTSSGRVRADDPVEDAWRLYLSADFDGALAAFERAEAGALDRADVLRILEGRAQIHFALGDEEAVRGALARLASLSPDYRLSPETPPDLVEAFAEIRETTPRLRIVATPTRQAGEARLSARVTGDVGGSVRGLRITGRVAGQPWSQATDEPLLLDANDDEEVEYYVDAVGVGGAILASEGTVDRPMRLTADASGLDSSEGGDEAAGMPPWAWIAIGGGSALAVGILIAVIAVVATNDAIAAEAPVLP